MTTKVTADLIDTADAADFRGAIWGAPFLPLALFDPALLAVPVAFLVAVPVAPYLFRDWEIQEFVRGAMAGAIILWLTA